MSTFCPTCGSCYKDVRAPVITVNGTVVCCDNWHWVWEVRTQRDPNVLTLSRSDRDLLRGMNIKVDD